MWFQGLVYFLSPQYTGQLFTTALNTHYMHTDDVFMGILVNKTKEFRTGTVWPIKRLALSKEKLFNLVKVWEKGRAIFYHVPQTRLFYTWYFGKHTD